MEMMTFGAHLILPLLHLVHSWTLLYSMPENHIHLLEKNHQLTTLAQLGEQFRISFDLWVEEYHDADEYSSRCHIFTSCILYMLSLYLIQLGCLSGMETFFTSPTAAKLAAMEAKRQ